MSRAQRRPVLVQVKHRATETLPMAPQQEQQPLPDPPDEIDEQLLQLLEHRYGDGLVYLRGDDERPVYEDAVRLGLVSAEGYLTPAGLALITRYGAD